MHLFLTNVQLLSSQDVNWWTGVVWIIVDYCGVFISCLDSHSDGTHSLQRIRWWPSDRCYIFFFNLMKKQTHLHLDDLKVRTFQQSCFWVNYSFNCKSSAWSLTNLNKEGVKLIQLNSFLMCFTKNSLQMSLCRPVHYKSVIPFHLMTFRMEKGIN